MTKAGGTLYKGYNIPLNNILLNQGKINIFKRENALKNETKHRERAYTDVFLNRAPTRKCKTVN